MAKSKKIVFTGGGTVGHVTLNLILIPKFLKDGWEVHYIGDKHGIEHEQIDKSGLDVPSIVSLQVTTSLFFMAKHVGCLKLVGEFYSQLQLLLRFVPKHSFQKADLYLYRQLSRLNY